MTTSSTTRCFVRACGLLSLMTVLGACSTIYTAEIRNDTPDAIYAGIYRTTEISSSTLASERLAPGDLITVGPVWSRHSRTYLQVDLRPNAGARAVATLRPGRNVLRVIREDDDLRVEPIGTSTR